MVRLSVRATLIALFVLLGAGLALSVAGQVVRAVGDWREMRDLARSNVAREELAELYLAITAERTDLVAALAQPSRGAPDGAIARTEEALGRVAASLERLGGEGALDGVVRQVGEVRRIAAGGAQTGPTARNALADFVTQAQSRAAGDVVALRTALIAQEPADRSLTAINQMRRYALLLLDDLERRRAVVTRLRSEPPTLAQPGLQAEVQRLAVHSDLVTELLATEAALLDNRFRQGMAQMDTTLDALARAEAAALAAPLAADRRALERWEETSGQALGTARAFLTDLFAEARAHIALRQAAAARSAGLWLGALLGGALLVGLGTWTVLGRVVRPLERLRSCMLALAQGDLSVPLPETRRGDEMALMADALRVFKANALRREHLQAERLGLHERLQEAYRVLRADLDAAAAVQGAMLPPPGRIGGVRFEGRLRPSHGISGDSFHVLRQPNGAVHFFLIDVAGHGAPAALASVASHYAASQAIQGRAAGESLGEILAAINRDWPEQMPYFTMVLGELRPEAGTGALVQAGHPSPLLLRHGDGVEVLGAGGLPVGVIPDAAWEEIRFPFGPGDRLLVFSDGLSEAESLSGEAFGEERLASAAAEAGCCGAGALVEAVTARLRDWVDGSDPADDMTLLVLDAVGAEG